MVNCSATDNDQLSEKTTESTAGICTPEWLTEEFYADVLKNEQKEIKKITKFLVTPAVPNGENFMTFLLRVVIDAELQDGGSTQRSFVTKVSPSNEYMRNLVRNWRVFEKEALVYGSYIPAFEELFRKAGKLVRFGPQMYPMENPKIAAEALMMEDLCERGFKNVKRQYGMDKKHTEAVLEKLALFHAASACRLENAAPYPDIFRQCLYSEVDKFAEYRDKISKLFRECLPLYNSSYLEEKLRIYKSVVPDQYQLRSPVASTEFSVLNHGDCWVNNIMFQYNKDGSIKDTYFIDFQKSRYGPPAQDLTYLLLSSTALENKFKHFDYFIYYYHKKLIENLELLNYPKTLPTLRGLHISLLKHGDWAYTVITNLLPVVLLDPNEDINVDTLLSDKADMLRRAMYTNPRYVEHVSRMLPWMDNRGLLEYVAQ